MAVLESRPTGNITQVASPTRRAGSGVVIHATRVSTAIQVSWAGGTIRAWRPLALFPSSRKGLRMKDRRRLLSLTLGALMSALVSGCAGSPASPEDTLAQRTASLDRVLSAAKAGGASAEQRRVLESGVVNFGTYQAAVGRTVACAQAAGIPVDGPSISQHLGFPTLVYGFGVSSPGRSQSETEALADECQRVNSAFLEQYYTNGPDAVAAQVDLLQKYRPSVLACLRDNGRTLPEDASSATILNALDRLLGGHDGNSVDCYSKTGYLVPNSPTKS